jgi:glutamine synthetase
VRTPRSTRSTRPRRIGIAARASAPTPTETARTSATSCARSRATFPRRRWTPTAICGRAWSSRWRPIDCEFHHHEVGSAGQAEINVRFDTLLRIADQTQLQKYVIKNVAREAGKSATFMPKPLYEENGSGMHVHQSLSRGGHNLMYDFNGFAQLSREALNYVGGLLVHAPALMAFCAPTTNSYRRLVPGYEAPVNLVYSQRNRSAAVRIPVYSSLPKTSVWSSARPIRARIRISPSQRS